MAYVKNRFANIALNGIKSKSLPNRLYCRNIPRMKIPITKMGLPQVFVFPAMIVVVMLIIAFAGHKAIMTGRAVLIVEILLVAVLVWVLAFFRDPERAIPAGEDILISPADGQISDIEIIDDERLGGKTIRIGIFLNVFNVHINRVPCAVRIEDIAYKEGEFKNALDPESARVNEANAVTMTRLCEPKDKLIVRQISGAIARRIVCVAKVGDEYSAGDRFGMIKFGSRTELYLPWRENAKVHVEIGDKVKAGLTVFVRYEQEKGV